MEKPMRALIALPLLLAACGEQAATTNETATVNSAAAAPAGYSPLQQRMVDLPQRQLDGVLLRAIRDGDAPCQGVTESKRQADQDGQPLYVARCNDGPVYAITVDRQGVAVVTRVSADRR
jgi:hypothetical protein